METDPTTPVPPIPWEDVLQQPWLIQALAVLFFASLVVQLIPKAAGRWSTTVEQWTDSRRRTKSASANGDVSALSVQVDNMEVVLNETRAELALSRAELAAFRAETRTYQQKHDETLGLHSRWDRGMIQLVVSLGGTPLPPMPLYPDVPGTPDRMRDMPGDGGVTDLDHP